MICFLFVTSSSESISCSAATQESKYMIHFASPFIQQQVIDMVVWIDQNYWTIRLNDVKVQLVENCSN